MIGLLILSAAILTGFGCYHLSCAFVDVPTSRTSRTMMIAKNRPVPKVRNFMMFILPEWHNFSPRL